MQTTLKKTLFAVLPLAGLLFLPPVVSARDGEHRDFHRDLRGEHRDFHHDRGHAHRDYHRDRRALHREFHDSPHTRREHRRFHRSLRRDHRGFHRDSKRAHRDFHRDLRDWHSDYHDWDRSFGRRYYDDHHYRSRYPRSFYSGQPWWYDFLYR